MQYSNQTQQQITDERFVIATLPQLPPNLQIPIQWPQNVARYSGAIISLIATDIQNNRHASYFRANLFNTIFVNYLQNESAAGLFRFAADLANLYIMNRTPQDQAVRSACEESVQMFLAIYSLRHPQLLQLLDQQTAMAFQQLAARAEEIKGHLMNANMASMPGLPMQQFGGLSAPMGGLSSPPAGLVSMPGIGLPGAPAGMPSVVGSTGRPSTQANAAPAPAMNFGFSPEPVASPTPSRPPSRYDTTGIDFNEADARGVDQVMNLPPNAVGQVTAKDVAVSSPLAAPAAPATSDGFNWGRSTQVKPMVADTTKPVEEPVTLPDPSLYSGKGTVVRDMTTEVQFDDRERPFDLIITPSGDQIAPAGLVDWKFTGNEARNYRLAYDPSEYLLVLVKSEDGVVTESLIEWNESMEYLDHELNSSLAAKERERRRIEGGKKQVFSSGWQLTQALTPNVNKTMAVVDEETLAGLRENPDLVDLPFIVEPIDNEDFTLVETLAQGMRSAEAALRLAGKPGLRGTSVELYLQIPQLMVFPSQEWAQRAEQLSSAESLDQLHEKLSVFQGMEDPELLAVLDQRITRIINETLREGMALPQWSIDSFVGDWKDLCAELVKDFGEESMLQILQDNSTLIIDSVFTTLSETETEEYLTQLGHFDPAMAAADEDVEEIDDAVTHHDQLPVDESAEAAVAEGEEEVAFTFTNVVVFIDRVSVTTLPETREGLSLRLDTGALIVAEYQPNLYQAASAVFTRTTDARVAFTHRYFVTSDNQFLELKRGLLNNDAMLLFDRGAMY